MDYHHSARFVRRLAQEACGDLYPEPLHAPGGMLRAADPLLALVADEALAFRPDYAEAIRTAMLGRPEGPLALCLWDSATAAGIELADLLALVQSQRPSRPPSNRGEFLARQQRRAAPLLRALFCVADRPLEPVAAVAQRFAAALALVHALAELPVDLRKGVLRLPEEELAVCGVDRAALEDGLRTPEVDALLQREAAWCRELLEVGPALAQGIHGRLARVVYLLMHRADRILRHVENPQRDPFRQPIRLARWEEWACAIGAAFAWPLRQT